jgi:hypothetical protein
MSVMRRYMTSHGLISVVQILRINLIEIPGLIRSPLFSYRKSISEILKTIARVIGVVEIFKLWPLKHVKPMKSAARMYGFYGPGGRENGVPVQIWFPSELKIMRSFVQSVNAPRQSYTREAYGCRTCKLDIDSQTMYHDWAIANGAIRSKKHHIVRYVRGRQAKVRP